MAWMRRLIATTKVALLAFLPIGCSSGGGTGIDPAVRFYQEMKDCPVTHIRLANRTGVVAEQCEVSFRCRREDDKGTRAAQGFASQGGPFGPEPELMMKHKWPDPLCIERITLVSAGRRVTCEVDRWFEPGADVLLEVDEGGNLSVK